MTKIVPKKTDTHIKEKDAQSKTTPAESNFSNVDQGEKDSVDRIRDILFGAQVRQYEQKFGILEDTIQKEITMLHEATKKSIESLENFTKKQLESLTAQLKTEQKERSETMNELSKTFDNANKNLEKKIIRLEDRANTIHQDLQEQILQQSKTLMNEIRQKHEEVVISLKKAAEELRNDKIDRIALGNLLNEMGLRLKEEFKIPNIK
jgi:hypothetical protein